MEGRDRTADLDRLADAAIERLEWHGESYWGLDGKRPFGSSCGSDVLDIVGIEPEEVEAGEFDFTEDQTRYGHELMADLADHVKERWLLFRAIAKAEGREGGA